MALVEDFGGPALFVILAVNCLGVPFPTSLIMLAIGALAAQDQWPLTTFLGWGILGAVAGDQLGYLLGRLGFGLIAAQSTKYAWLSSVLRSAESFEGRWGDLGIFLSRWLFSPLGPYVNLFAGMTAYSWVRFTMWDIAGESVWVGIYMGLGVAFSRSVQNLADLLGDLTWMVVFGAITVILAVSIWSQRTRRAVGSP